MKLQRCSICGEEFEDSELYEYRGVIACHPHFEELQNKRNFERQQIIAEEKHKTEKFRGLDLSDSTIGKVNKSILKKEIEISKKESLRIKTYES